MSRMGHGRPPRRYDCGSHGQLTAVEISRIAGIGERAVYGRVGMGIRGERLCLPAKPRRKRTGTFHDGLHVPFGGNSAMFIACLLANHFRGGAPDVEVLQAKFGMQRATAYRWRRAWLDANGQP